ncbi:hypothetical protein [Rubritalea tangerina]|uniref:Uncharacterized protein n=1 Tax=Rubritalea tangerina TaxID=430798 RepID=A0ABW4Z7P3_9BACT
MITEDLKTKVKNLSNKDRSDLSTYITKLKLEEDADFWATIRERTESYGPSTTVDIEDL